MTTALLYCFPLPAISAPYWSTFPNFSSFFLLHYFVAGQQLQFLEGRRKQLMAAALRSKQHKDIEGAKMYLRQAKGLDQMLEASRGGLPVDITKVA